MSSLFAYIYVLSSDYFYNYWLNKILKTSCHLLAKF